MVNESLGRFATIVGFLAGEESAYDFFNGDERKGYRDFVPGRLVVLLDFGDKAVRGDIDIGSNIEVKEEENGLLEGDKRRKSAREAVVYNRRQSKRV